MVSSKDQDGYDDWEHNNYPGLSLSLSLSPTLSSISVLTIPLFLSTDAVPIWNDYYMWNLTNIQEVLTGTAKPKYEVVGPFSYRYTSLLSLFSFDTLRLLRMT